MAGRAVVPVGPALIRHSGVSPVPSRAGA
jgi:hypothetical protein